MIDDEGEKPLRLFRVALPVRELEASVAFYRQVLRVDGERIGPGRHYFDCGGTILACVDPAAEGHGNEVGPNEGYVYFAVGDLDACFERVRTAGCQWLDDGPKTREWGERSFYAHDPFGNRICFVAVETTFLGGGPRR
jgi:catechol 2,3-dioxygenase-like lactoylglutathione lyase family enzyme